MHLLRVGQEAAEEQVQPALAAVVVPPRREAPPPRVVTWRDGALMDFLFLAGYGSAFLDVRWVDGPGAGMIGGKGKGVPGIVIYLGIY